MTYESQAVAQRSPGETAPAISYEKFLNQPGDNHHVEWVQGRMVPMSPVTEAHENVRGFLYSLLRHFVEYHKLGRIYSEPFQMKTGPALPGLAPDIFFVATANLHRVRPLCLEGPADLVIEIISPGSRATDRGDKFYEYEDGGVPEYWLLDPERKQAEFYRRGPDKIYRAEETGGDGIYYSKALPGLWIRLDWLWQPLPPPALDVLRQWKLI